MDISRQIFDEQRFPRFGNANPQRMQMDFWEWMILGGESDLKDAFSSREEVGPIVREGKLKSAYGPYRARDLFKVPRSRDEGPIWTFDRMGATRTTLADGRVVCIAGEHEDYYDPDFWIYNDVVVLGTAGRIEIYGYPREVFPPTDFHTATLVQGQLFIVGCLGYMDARVIGQTPVYILDLSGYSISKMLTSGEMPGWIHEHEADLDPEGFITIRGGQIIYERDGKEHFRRNFDDYSLDVSSGVWRRLTSRNWRQFNIRQEDGKPFVLDRHPPAEALVPEGAKQSGMSSEDRNVVRFVIQGVPVSLKVGILQIEVILEEDLPDEMATRIAQEVRANVQRTIQRVCKIDRV